MLKNFFAEIFRNLFFLIVTSENLNENLPKIQIAEVGHGLSDTVRPKLKIVLFFCHNHA